MSAQTHAQTNLQLFEQLHRADYSDAELNLVRRAYGLAVVLFTGRFQPSGKSFLAHVVGTASILATLRSSAPLLAAGLLHNVYENGDFGSVRAGLSRKRRSEIVRLLGAEVEEVAAQFGRIGWTSAAVQTARYNPAQLSTVERSVLLVRLADFLEHLLDLDVLYYGEKVRRYYLNIGVTAVETADNLGLSALAEEMRALLGDTLRAELPVKLAPSRYHDSSFVVVPNSCCRRKVLALSQFFTTDAYTLTQKLLRRAKRLRYRLTHPNIFLAIPGAKRIALLTLQTVRPSCFESKSHEFETLFPEDAVLVPVATGFKFTEGPVWIPAAGKLLLSDIPANRIFSLTSTGRSAIFRKRSGGSNGLTLDKLGRLVVCEQSGRRVSRTEKDGSITVLAASFRDKRLNSPNDVVVKSDGAIYFTDPNYGIRPEEQEQEVQGVYRLSRDGHDISLVAHDFARPNGLAFSPDEKKLYVDDSERRHIRVFNVNDDGSLSGGAVFHDMNIATPGAPDGMKVDVEGRVYCTGAGGVWVFSSQGNHLGTIVTPEKPSNCSWGDDDWRSLYITAGTSVYKIRVNIPGVGTSVRRLELSQSSVLDSSSVRDFSARYACHKKIG